jgi:hypothetical protein
VEDAQVSGHVKVKDGFRPVFVPDAFQLRGDPGEGFVPGNPFEFAFTPFPDPLKRVEDAVGGINPLPEGAAPLAGPELGLFAVIGLDPGDHPVTDMDPEQAGPAAMAGTHGGDYFIFGILFIHKLADIHILP